MVAVASVVVTPASLAWNDEIPARGKGGRREEGEGGGNGEGAEVEGGRERKVVLE